MIQEADIRDWKQLAELADAHKNQDWIYRGVPRSDYELVPTIGRKSARSEAKQLKYSLKQERILLYEFMRQARPLVSISPQGTLEWMALGQQHGLATRLLDWTESLFVAAFFATVAGVSFQDEIVEIDGEHRLKRKFLFPRIYGVKGLPAADGEEDPFKITRVKVYRPAHITNRIAPQLAAFTVHPKPSQPFKGRNVHFWELKIRGTLGVREVLDATGISHASLFPGIDGLTDGLNWKYKWDRLRK